MAIQMQLQFQTETQTINILVTDSYSFTTKKCDIMSSLFYEIDEIICDGHTNAAPISDRMVNNNIKLGHILVTDSGVAQNTRSAN